MAHLGPPRIEDFQAILESLVARHLHEIAEVRMIWWWGWCICCIKQIYLAKVNAESWGNQHALAIYCPFDSWLKVCISSNQHGRIWFRFLFFSLCKGLCWHAALYRKILLDRMRYKPSSLSIPVIFSQKYPFLLAHSQVRAENDALRVGGLGYHGQKAVECVMIVWAFQGWKTWQIWIISWGFPKMVVPNSHWFSY